MSEHANPTTDLPQHDEASPGLSRGPAEGQYPPQVSSTSTSIQNATMTLQTHAPTDVEANQEDDIWASSSPDDDHDGNGNRVPTEEMLSDIPSLRREHMTSGYREGLAVGKARVMQDGFDAGYPLGIEVGLRSGAILGVLEGVVAATSEDPGKGVGMGRMHGADEVGVGVADGEESGSKGQLSSPKGLGEVRKMYDRAKSELVITALLAGLDDEVVSKAERVPRQVEEVLERWEEVVRRVTGLRLGS